MGHIIYRGTSPYNMSLLTSIASTYSTYSDLNPPLGTAYYQVEAVNQMVVVHLLGLQIMQLQD